MNGNDQSVLVEILSIQTYDRLVVNLSKEDKFKLRNGSVYDAKVVIQLTRRYDGVVIARLKFGFVRIVNS